MSAQKMREVVRQIQGLPALQAQAVLAVVPRKSARARGQDSEVRHRQCGEQQQRRSRETLRVKEAVARNGDDA